ncbi:hypothetical protein LIX60_07820 [Streptomyces sp. S07_1.15]|uniref:DUF6571 family protein n=1 Tax=Streptomyces sp. S07_1.15 TaxID=2873925 RepID=UPI001D13FBAF|nr:hypothetical protein [Streptomyces sp. S07_1.15]MCC3651377.1 hypothetical protein [Streptomyces sp. S07_1.15]
MDFEALHSANFAKLDDTVTEWDTLVNNLKTLEKSAREGLRGKANKANWGGYNAAISREFIGKTAGEFDDAHTQAQSIRNIIRDTRNELRVQKNELLKAIARGKENHLLVRTRGSGFTVEDPHNKASGGQKAVDALRDELQGILDKATEIDTTAATALKALVDNAEYGFSEARYADRDSAADAIKAAEEVGQLLRKDPHDVTNTELTTLNGVLAKYKNDPLFAEKIAIDAGPKRVLEFYAAIADPYQGYGYEPKRGEEAKRLQKNLGITLGTATLTQSRQMAEWEREMVKLGPEQLGIDDASDPRGFAVMSNLMRFGDYDDRFLNEYGERLIAFDKERNVEHMSPWINNWNHGDLNYWGENDRGRDPLTGFLQALGHNPGASTEFFAQPPGTEESVDKESELNKNLAYLTKERIWLSDAPMMGGDDKVVAGRNALGHALEAATTGYAYDAAPMPGEESAAAGGDRRTAETAGVMEQVAFLYGSEDGPKMLHEQPELADSLGKMGAAYIDDINYGLSGLGNNAKDGDNFPARYEGRAEFGNQGAIDFLSVLGQNETSHKIMTAAEHIYTLSVLDNNPPSSDGKFDHGRDALVMEARARGILDHSRVQQAGVDYQGEAEEYNKSLGRSAEWGKYAIGAAITTGVACIPVPGAAAGAVAIAPLATNLAGEALKTFLGQEVDDSVGSSEQGTQEKEQLTSREFFDRGISSLGQSYEAYFNHAESADKADTEQVREELRSTYLATGTSENDYRGRPAYRGD